jgi:hypothetical protein
MAMAFSNAEEPENVLLIYAVLKENGKLIRAMRLLEIVLFGCYWVIYCINCSFSSATA